MKISIWLEGIRLKTLGASISPVLIGTVFSLKTHPFDTVTTLLILLFALGVQIATNLANDYFDYIKGADTKDRKGPRRLTQSGLVAPHIMQWVALSVTLCSALIALYLTIQGGWIVALIAVISLLAAYLYTAGPFPLAYIGLGDVFVLIFFGPLAVAGTVYLQTKIFSPLSIIVGLAPGFLSTALLVINHLRDRQEDLKAKKNTLIVRFGFNFGKWEYLLCYICAALIPLILIWVTKENFLIICAILPLLLTLPEIKSLFYQQVTPLLYQTLFKKTIWSLTLFTLVFTVTWLISNQK